MVSEVWRLTNGAYQLMVKRHRNGGVASQYLAQATRCQKFFRKNSIFYA
jgi:hypothetical protein